jgi:hypothetical protein
MYILLEHIYKAKELFNEYSQVKDWYSSKPVPEREERLKDALAAFLSKVLQTCEEIETKTESRGERDLLRQFAIELTGIFK